MTGIAGIMGLAMSGGGKKCNVYSLSGIWVCPGVDTPVRVLVIAAGGGGGGSTPYGGTVHGGAGGTSSFGPHVSAVGGGGGYGSATYSGSLSSNSYASAPSNTNGSQVGGESFIQTNGVTATSIYYPGIGGEGYMGIGRGGNGSRPFYYSAYSIVYLGGSGGASGRYNEWEGTVSSNITVTVGAGGAGGISVSPHNPGRFGMGGAVFVWWEE